MTSDTYFSVKWAMLVCCMSGDG